METIQCSVWHQSLIKHGSHFASQRESYVVCRPWRTFSEGVVEEGRSTSGCHRCQSFSRATELRAEENRARQPKAELRVKQAATRARSMSFGVQNARPPGPSRELLQSLPYGPMGCSSCGVACQRWWEPWDEQASPRFPASPHSSYSLYPYSTLIKKSHISNLPVRSTIG